MDRIDKPADAQRLALLIDASNDGFWDWNVVTGEVYFGGRWGEMLGYRPDEIEPHVRTWERLVHPDDLPWVMETLQAHLDGRTDHYQAEHRLLARDGTWRWILDRGRVVERDADGRPRRACGAHIDVTERKLVELEKERIARDRVQLLGMVSHELKNPMQAILSGAETIERSFTTPLAQRLVPQSLEGIRRALRRMTRLVTDLLDTTRLEGGGLALHLQTVPWRPVLDAAVQGLPAELGRKQLRIDVAGAAEEVVRADPERLTQIVANLLENAVKFSPEGGIISIRCGRDEGRRATLTVHDMGPGIPEADRPHVFERFWQGKANAYQGIGLGLYIARGLAESHGGRLDVVDSDGPGATFRLSLPDATAARPESSPGR